MAAIRLDIRSKGVPECLARIDRLTLWELLRRFDRPVEVKDLARVGDRSSDQVQEALDDLLAIGVVTRVPAGRGRRTRWRTTGDSIVVHYRVNDPDDEHRLSRMGRLFDERRRQEIRAATKSDRERGPTEFMYQSLHAGRFTAEEIRELWDLLQKIEAFFHRSNLKYQGIDGTEETDCNYHVSIDISPLRPGVQALPTLQIVGDHVADDVAGRQLVDPLASLTAREAEVARLLAAGRSRPAVAEQLGVAESTIREHTQRIYRKLGVRSRVELARRMGDGK